MNKKELNRVRLLSKTKSRLVDEIDAINKLAERQRHNSECEVQRNVAEIVELGRELVDAKRTILFDRQEIEDLKQDREFWEELAGKMEEHSSLMVDRVEILDERLARGKLAE